MDGFLGLNFGFADSNISLSFQSRRVGSLRQSRRTDSCLGEGELSDIDLHDKLINSDVY